ncbi:MAG TPA: chloride channel protein [Vicinamibacterales bacterium]|nr:chloride channel protein [Vicinamibacterales bacterium]
MSASDPRPPKPLLTEEQLFLLIAILIGIYSGLAVVGFRLAIEWTRLLLLGSTLRPSFPRVVLVPSIVGLVVAVFVVLVFPAVRGSGVNQTKAALYIYDGYIAFRTVIGKFLMCALAIGAGQSLGPEDPSLQIGAGLASAFGRRLKLPAERLRYIAPVGAAAGLAAAFNSPITAVLFVIEEVIGRWSAGVLGAVVLSAVASVVTEQWFLGDEPLFRVPTYHLVHSAELLAYAALGVIGGAVSIVFVKAVGALRPRLRALPPWTWYIQPAIAGLLIGLIALRFPQVMGAGYEYIDQAMHDRFGWRTLVALCLLKVVTTTASFVSGTPGGLFAPTLFIGAMLGGAVCAIERQIAPNITGPIGAYALVGMGTLFAGILRAPMTSVFMIVEVSGNYSIILPVMISNTIAHFLSRQFQQHALFDMLSRQDGTVLPSMEEEREIDVRTVGEVMRRTDEVIRDSHDDHPYLYPDQSIDTALRLLQGRSTAPVVHRADPRRIVGLFVLEDVIKSDATSDAAAAPGTESH